MNGNAHETGLQRPLPGASLAVPASPGSKAKPSARIPAHRFTLPVPSAPRQVRARIIRGAASQFQPVSDIAAPVIGERELPPQPAMVREDSLHTSPPAPPPVPVEARESERLAESLLDALAALLESREQALLELQELAVRLAVHVARAVLQYETSLSAERVAGLVRRAIEQMGPRPEVTVFVSPGDMERVAGDEGLARKLPTAVHWRTDEGLRPGDVRIDGGAYGLESLAETQLEEIQFRLLEALQDAQVERRRAAGSGQSLGRFPDRRDGP